MIVGKMQVTEVTVFAWNPKAKKIKLQTQYDSSIPEDRAFKEATPSASLEAQITNPAIFPELEAGAVKFVLFMTPEEYAQFSSVSETVPEPPAQGV